MQSAASESVVVPLRVVDAKGRPFMPVYGACDSHGKYQLNMLDERGVERWRPDVCQLCSKEAAARELMGRAAISPRFAGCSFNSFRVENDRQADVLKVCREYAELFAANHAAGRCLILRGNPGTGKNHLAVSISLEVIQQGFSVSHATAFEIVGRIKESWGRNEGEKELDIIRRFSELDLLVIDEVGRQFGKDADHILLFHVLDARYRLMRPTIVISNKTPDEIKTYLTAAGYDRLREGGGMLLNFDWESERGK